MPAGGSRKQLGAKEQATKQVSISERSHLVQFLKENSASATITTSNWRIYNPIEVSSLIKRRFIWIIKYGGYAYAPESIAATVNISLTQSNSQDASRALAI